MYSERYREETLAALSRSPKKTQKLVDEFMLKEKEQEISKRFLLGVGILWIGKEKVKILGIEEEFYYYNYRPYSAGVFMILIPTTAIQRSKLRMDQVEFMEGRCHIPSEEEK